MHYIHDLIDFVGDTPCLKGTKIPTVVVGHLVFDGFSNYEIVEMLSTAPITPTVVIAECFRAD